MPQDTAVPSYTIVTEAERMTLCQKKIDSPKITQTQLAAWVETTFCKKISQGTFSNTLKRSAELLADGKMTNTEHQAPQGSKISFDRRSSIRMVLC